MSKRLLPLPLLGLAAALSTAPGNLHAQGVLVGANDVGIGIGDVRKVTGIRINYRDRGDFDVHGINITIWTPYEGDLRGEVHGLAIGLPATGAARIQGIGVGIFGVGTSEEFSGIGIGGLGVGAGNDIEGIHVGGLGVGAGDDVSGIAVGGLGVGGGGRATGLLVGGLGAGVGEDVRGIALGGLGVGAGGDFTGIGIGGAGVGSGGRIQGLVIGGLGVGAGESLKGISVGGVGVGSGGDISGLAIGGIGVGSGQDIRGMAFGGVGVGAGNSIRWLAISAVGVGSPKIVGAAIAPLVGAEDMTALVIAPAYMRIEHGVFRGVSASAFNHIKGEQRGLTIGVVNYAWRLHGVQLGLINVAKSNPRGLRVLPIVNFDAR